MAVRLSYGDTLLTDEDVALLDGCVQSKAMRVRVWVSACTELISPLFNWHRIPGISQQAVFMFSRANLDLSACLRQCLLVAIACN